jgi:hypothetical protein
LDRITSGLNGGFILFYFFLAFEWVFFRMSAHKERTFMYNRTLRMLAVGLLTALTVHSIAPLYAAESVTPPVAGKAADKGKTIPYRGKISAVDRTTKTITLGGKEKSRVFQVTAETRILKQGKPVTWEEVLVGEQVRGQARMMESGLSELISLYLGPKGDDTKGAEPSADGPPPSAKSAESTENK